MVDGVWSVIGSANFDNRSVELNDELTVAVQDRELAATLTAHFEDDIRQSRKLDARTWGDRSLWQKTRELFWAQYGELF
jgi:cardiolipin synthase